MGEEEEEEEEIYLRRGALGLLLLLVVVLSAMENATIWLGPEVETVEAVNYFGMDMGKLAVSTAAAAPPPAPSPQRPRSRERSIGWGWTGGRRAMVARACGRAGRAGGGERLRRGCGLLRGGTAGAGRWAGVVVRVRGRAVAGFSKRPRVVLDCRSSTRST